jgi:hypothetical protein
MFQDKNEIIIEETEENIFMDLIKFIYTGKIENEKEEDLIKIIKLGNKYSINQIKLLKFPGKFLFKAILGILFKYKNSVYR